MRPRRRRQVWGVSLCLAAALLGLMWVRSHQRYDWITLALGEYSSIEIYSWEGEFAVQYADGPHPPTSWLHYIPSIGRFGELRGRSRWSVDWPVRFVRAGDNGGATATGGAAWYAVPVVTLAGLGVWALTRTRLRVARRLAARRATGPRCRRCGYDLRGTPAGRSCPECGA